MKILKILSIVGLLLSLFISCEKARYEYHDYLVFPIGRSFLTASTVEVKINGNIFSPNIVYDSCGGYWLSIPFSEIDENEKVSIRFIRKREDVINFTEEDVDTEKWLLPSYYIDSDDEAIKNKAIELTQELNSNNEKAKVIQQFVIHNVRMTGRNYAYYAKASTTLAQGAGICINFSRLYVALCRAANIPARSVWGLVYGYNNDKNYDYHHQWAEILGDDGKWYASDFGYTKYFNLNDIRYLDLIYAAEENTVTGKYKGSDIMMHNLKVLNNCPMLPTGRLGFKLVSDNRPDSMVVEYDYIHSTLNY